MEALRLSPTEALIKYKLAPLRTRRDIALLGFLHRFAHHKAPSCFNDLFHFGEASALARRRSQAVHDRQIHDPIDGTQSRALERSVYGLIYTYNSFPPEVVAAPDTSGFQRFLQRAVVKASGCAVSQEWWPAVLYDGVRKLNLACLHELFK